MDLWTFIPYNAYVFQGEQKERVTLLFVGKSPYQQQPIIIHAKDTKEVLESTRFKSTLIMYLHVTLSKLFPKSQLRT